MTLKVAIQMDPIEAVDIAGDTTFLMAETAQARGHNQWVYDFRTLALEEGRLYCRARSVILRQTVGDHVSLGDWERLDIWLIPSKRGVGVGNRVYLHICQ